MAAFDAGARHRAAIDIELLDSGPVERVLKQQGLFFQAAVVPAATAVINRDNSVIDQFVGELCACQ